MTGTPNVWLTGLELRALGSLASLFSIRMLGLFMALPVLATDAFVWEGANEYRIGLALGIYGLSQGLLQIPFGWLSDKFGRKPLLYIGLLLLVMGSLVAAFSESIQGLIFGRMMQGSGAIGCVVLACIADQTRETVRSLSMAIFGASIGLSFMVAMALGPLITQLWGIRSLFVLTAGLALFAMLVVRFALPNAPSQQSMRTRSLSWDLQKIIRDSEVLRLILSIFFLHAILAALFLVFPVLLKQQWGSKPLWWIYAPVLLGSLMVAVPLMIYADRRKISARLQLGSILGLGLSVALLLASVHSGIALGGSLLLFFIAFNLLEANLPASLSRLASSESKGTTLGVFSSAQFLGVFCGGVAGGTVHAWQGQKGILLACLACVGLWLLLFQSMKQRSSSSKWGWSKTEGRF